MMGYNGQFMMYPMYMMQPGMRNANMQNTPNMPHMNANPFYFFPFPMPNIQQNNINMGSNMQQNNQNNGPQGYPDFNKQNNNPPSFNNYQQQYASQMQKMGQNPNPVQNLQSQQNQQL